MKKILKLIISSSILLFTKIFPPFIFELIGSYFSRIYSLYHKNLFLQSGKNLFIEYDSNIKGHKYIIIGENFYSHKGLRIEAWDSFQNQKFKPKIKIGKEVSINYYCHIGAINLIEISDNVLIGSNVFITDHSHGDNSSESLNIMPKKRNLISKGAVIIERNVWICENVTVLPNVRIGKNTVIGANSVVTQDIPENCIAVGNPARVVKKSTI